MQLRPKSKRGNPLLDEAFDADWQPRYAALLGSVAPMLMVRLEPQLGDQEMAPLCLMCSERNPCDCHRLDIARLLERRGHSVVHLGA